MITNPALSPDLEWFQTQWNLPDARIPSVQNYVLAESYGSTALELPADGSVKDWAEAAIAVEVGSEAPESPQPLVVVKNGKKIFLQSWLYYKAELEIAKSLRGRQTGAFDAEIKPEQLKKLFPGAGEGDLQMKAVEVAIRQRLTLITGGPGTGKTYTLARILTMIVEQGISASKI